MTPFNTFPPKSRPALLDELASLTSIERGSRVEEFRQRAAPDGSDPIIRGPYFKYQVWAEGKNQSSRVPAHEVDALRQDLENGKRFAEVTEELADLAIAQSRELRKAITPKAALASGQELLEKKSPSPVPRGKIPGNRKAPRHDPNRNRATWHRVRDPIFRVFVAECFLCGSHRNHGKPAQ
jgi:hypothetical protein